MRVIWKGTVSFRLVSVPVSLYSGAKRRKLPFRLLHEKDSGPIGYRKFCEKEDSEVDEDEIVKGYEIADNEYVILEDEDFEAAEVDLSHTIEIDTFVESDRLRPEWFNKPYYLQVNKNEAKPYILLRKAMEETGKVAIAKTVLRNREHLCCLMPRGEFLLLVLMRFSEELRPLDSLNAPPEVDLMKKEIDTAKKLINEMTEKFDYESYKDEYRERLKEIIEKKAEEEEIALPEKKKNPKTKDIMDALEKSLEQAG